MSGGLEHFNDPPKESVVRGEILISFEGYKSKHNKWNKQRKMFNGEWVALQVMKKLIRMKLFPVVYRELLPRAWDKSWYRNGFSRIVITYGGGIAEQSLRIDASLYCDCKFSDAWRCAVHENLHGHVACDCICHSTFGRNAKWKDLSLIR